METKLQMQTGFIINFTLDFVRLKKSKDSFVDTKTITRLKSFFHSKTNKPQYIFRLNGNATSNPTTKLEWLNVGMDQERRRAEIKGTDLSEVTAAFSDFSLTDLFL